MSESIRNSTRRPENVPGRAPRAKVTSSAGRRCRRAERGVSRSGPPPPRLPLPPAAGSRTARRLSAVGLPSTLVRSRCFDHRHRRGRVPSSFGLPWTQRCSCQGVGDPIRYPSAGQPDLNVFRRIPGIDPRVARHLAGRALPAVPPTHPSQPPRSGAGHPTPARAIAGGRSRTPVGFVPGRRRRRCPASPRRGRAGTADPSSARRRLHGRRRGRRCQVDVHRALGATGGCTRCGARGRIGLDHRRSRPDDGRALRGRGRPGRT